MAVSNVLRSWYRSIITFPGIEDAANERPSASYPWKSRLLCVTEVFHILSVELRSNQRLSAFFSDAWDMLYVPSTRKDHEFWMWFSSMDCGMKGLQKHIVTTLRLRWITGYAAFNTFWLTYEDVGSENAGDRRQHWLL